VLCRSADSNPGEATPRSLFKLYKSQGAVMANPCTLRQQFGPAGTTAAAAGMRPLQLSIGSQQMMRTLQLQQRGLNGAREAACATTNVAAPLLAAPLPQAQAHAARTNAAAASAAGRRGDSPPRMQFRVIQQRKLLPDDVLLHQQAGQMPINFSSLTLQNHRTS
jgi:hypothetical protein